LHAKRAGGARRQQRDPNSGECWIDRRTARPRMHSSGSTPTASAPTHPRPVTLQDCAVIEEFGGPVHYPALRQSNLDVAEHHRARARRHPQGARSRVLRRRGHRVIRTGAALRTAPQRGESDSCALDSARGTEARAPGSRCFRPAGAASPPRATRRGDRRSAAQGSPGSSGTWASSPGRFCT